MDIPPNIYLLYNMDLVLTKKFTMVKQVTDALNLELDERNIENGYNTVKMMDFSRHNHIGWWVRYQGWREIRGGQ